MEWASEHFRAAGFDEAFEAMMDGPARWQGRNISYALIDAGVYDALPEVCVAADEHLPQSLQYPWKAALQQIAPIDIEDSDQYCGFEGEDRLSEPSGVRTATFCGQPWNGCGDQPQCESMASP